MKKPRYLPFLLFLLMTFVYAAPRASAKYLHYEEDGQINEKLHMPVYHWSETNVSPCGIVIAIHGVSMHGRSYDGLGRQLATMGFEVYATDLRGYGRNLDHTHKYCESKSDCKHKVKYRKSIDDLTRLAQYVRKEHPGIPVYFVGESLGSSLAVRFAAIHPELTDGLILAAPAVRPHSIIDSKTLTCAGLMAAFPRAQCDVSPFVGRYGKGDPVVAEELKRDPLVRRKLSGIQVLQSCWAVYRTLPLAKRVKSDVPVLVLQGSADRCVKANAVVKLLSTLKSSDQTVRWFHSRGHILLETAHIKPDTMQTVCGWLVEHTENSRLGYTAAKQVEGHITSYPVQ